MSGTVGLSQSIEYDTLSGLIDKGSQAFAGGQYARASELFRKLQTLYSDEPEWTQTRLSEKVLPIAGYAALKAGLYEQAIDSLQRFLDEENPAYSQESFAKYSIALAYMRQGEHEAALTAFADFREGAHSTSQIGIAMLQEARIHIEAERGDDALETLGAILESDAADRVRAQARLLASRQYLEKQDFPNLIRSLAGSPWMTDSMPELALLAFLSIEAGDALMEAGLANEALQAYRLAPSRDDLLVQQSAKLATLKRRFEARRGSVGMGGIMWTEFYEQLIGNATAQLDALRQAEDYSYPLLLRRGRASLLAHRPFEAWLLFERVARDAVDPYAEQSHFHWILAARELGRPNEAIAIARDYLDRYPSSPRLDDTLYLIAQSMLDQHKFDEAIAALGELADRASDPELRLSCLFQRGQCFLRSGRSKQARQDFLGVASEAPQSKIADKARIWNGIALFLEHHFEDALAAFESLAENAQDTRLKGEALYRSATALYSLSRYERAATALQAFVRTYPDHQRRFEATLLSGDCAFARDRIEEAIGHYQSIPPDWPEIGQIAAIQTSDAYLELGKPEDALAAIDRRTRLAVTYQDRCELSLIESGIHLESGKRALAIDTLDRSLASMGNAPEAMGLFEALQMRHFLQPLDLENDYRAALEGESFAWAGRLGLLLSLENRENGRPFRAKELILELANELPPESLGPACIAHFGLELARLDFPEGIELLERLQSQYPDSPYEALAYFGFAWTQANQSNPHIALSWLERISETAIESGVYIDALALKGKLSFQTGEYAAAQRDLNAILSFKWARSADKANALVSLADLKASQGEPKQAIAYYQRVFTLYPGVGSAAAQSYLGSAQRLNELHEIEKARETIVEFLNRSELRDFPEYSEAQALLDQLEEASAPLDAEGGPS